MHSAKVRIGVLGTARIADALVRAIRMSSNSELTAIASRDRVAAQKWAAARDVPHVFGSYDDLLASGAVDLVYIPLPNAMHKEWSIKAMRSGKDVLCEKPLAGSADDVREMMAVAEATGVRLMEGFMYRFHPQITRLRGLLAEGAIGDVKLIRATFGFFLNRPADVRWSADLAGGALMDVGCYCVDISRLVAGSDPLSASAHMKLAQSGVDETFAGVLEFPDCMALIDSSFRTGNVVQQGLSLSGTHGRISLTWPFSNNEGAQTITIDRSGGGEAGGPVERIEVPGAYQVHLMIESLADAILNNHPTPRTLEDSLGTMQSLDALKEAARTGRRVQI